MNILPKVIIKKGIKDEKGQILILVLILLVLGSLVITPMLAFMATGSKTGMTYRQNTEELYAADAGIEDGTWQIKYDQLEEDEVTFPGYHPYDYDNSWPYVLSEQVNEEETNVTIQNIWIPWGLTHPSKTNADLIIQGIPEDPPNPAKPPKVIITGNVLSPPPTDVDSGVFEIKIQYYHDPFEELLEIETLGIWLPPGFHYDAGGDSNIDDYYSGRDIFAHAGGEAVVWSFSSYPFAGDGFDEPFPVGDDDYVDPLDYPMTSTITFQFTGPANKSPTAVSWIDTNLDLTQDEGSPVTYTWDADIKVYKIVSVSGDTEIEAYTAKSEIREMGSAIAGDYVAIGDTLLTATVNAYYRDRLYKESSDTVQEFTGSGDVPPGYVPENAHVDAAYLYWSGWIEGAGDATSVWSDPCDNFNNWLRSSPSHWSFTGGWDSEFMGQGGGTDASRTLTMNIPVTGILDLSAYSGQEVTVSWEQRESQTGWGWPPPQLEPGDCLKYAFSGDGGSHWSDYFVAFYDDDPADTFSGTIPDEYVTGNFKMRFLLDFDESNEYCYIDDISITASSGSSVGDAKVNRVLFNGNQITANLADCQTEPTPLSSAPDAWCYSCYYDATSLVQQFIAAGSVEPNGSGTYTLGHWTEGSGYSLYGGGATAYPLATPALNTHSLQYQYSYAGWSLIIIYSSPETKGHQLYLFDDDFRYIAVGATLDFNISGFLVPERVQNPDGTWEQYASHMTCFVGDGDEHYPGDFIALNAPEGMSSHQIPNEYKLWDGITIGPIQTGWSHQWFPNNASSPNNVWNGQSVGLTASGIDIDNFNVTWDWALGHDLEPGKTSAKVSLGNASTNPSDAELIMVVYVIISFRSETTTGGALSYLIR